MVPVALIVLEEVKDKVPYCGGDTHVYRLPKIPSQKKRQTLWDSHKMRQQFEEDIRLIVRDARDPRISEADFETKTQSLVERLREIHRLARNSSQPG